MRQIHVRTPARRFALCLHCKTEPRHVEHHGRTLRETMQKGVPALRHSLECRCGRSTGLHASLQGAEADWGQRFGQIVLDLPAPIPFPSTGRRRAAAKETARG
jgi:hypothetical protein